MSIKARLVLTILLLLAAALSGMVGAVVLDAGPRVETESISTAKLTERLIRGSLAALATASDPRAALEKLTDNFTTLRHVQVVLATKVASAPLETEQTASFWSSFVGETQQSPIEIPVHANGRLIDVVLVLPKPQDEMQEVWAAIARIVEYGALLSLALIPLTSMLITRSLAPVQRVTRALHELEDGNYDVEIPEAGPPEIAESCKRLNTLAGALRTSRAKVTELSARIVHVQDEERREVVRELHDDLGPHLFALRARTAALERSLLKDQPDLDRAIEDVNALSEHIDAVQQTNRRVLNRLVPAGLLELGLERALAAMGTTWRKEQPAINLQVEIRTSLANLDETACLTIYRVCQEALTNAYRHSGARNISVGVGIEPPSSRRAASVARIEVVDDGRGLSAMRTNGRGLQGMRERVVALGGTLDLSPCTPSGLRLTVCLPA